jgi:hypothetical protein
MATRKERDLLQKDAESKLDVISDLISKNNRILQEIDKLRMRHAETVANMKVSERERATKEQILTQRIADLESELGHQRTKYKKAQMALSEMEAALVVRGLEIYLYGFVFVRFYHCLQFL